MGATTPVVELSVAGLPPLARGDRAVLVWLSGSDRASAEAVFVAAAAPEASRFQLLSSWRRLERRGDAGFETNVRVDIRNIRDGLAQEATLLDVSEAGLHVETRRPLQGAVQALIHEGAESTRIPCDVVETTTRGQRTETRLRFRDLSDEQVTFIERIALTYDAGERTRLAS